MLLIVPLLESVNTSILTELQVTTKTKNKKQQLPLLHKYSWFSSLLTYQSNFFIAPTRSKVLRGSSYTVFESSEISGQKVVYMLKRMKNKMNPLLASLGI